MFIIELITVLVLVGIDLLTKGLIEANIGLGESVPIIENVLNFTLVHNTGAAFSILEGKMLLFYILTPIVVIALTWYLWKIRKNSKLEQFCIVLIIAGALGNLYDRAVFQYVRDFIDVQFMDFAVFNFADICLVVGSIALIIYLIVSMIIEYKKKDTKVE